MSDPFASLAPLYDQVFPSTEDLATWEALARGTGATRALDLGTGTGRLALHLSRRGFVATGLDLSPSMLRVAAGKGGGDVVRWLRADVRALPLVERFDAAFLAARTLEFVPGAVGRRRALAEARRCLRPEGLFAGHVAAPAPADQPEASAARLDAAELALDDGRWGLVWHERLSRAESRRSCRLDLACLDRPAPPRPLACWSLEWCEPRDLAALLGDAGFEDVRLYGGWDLRPWGIGSQDLIWTCRRPA